MEMLLQKYLRDGGSPIELLKKYAVTSKTHPRYPNLVQYKYNQIESPMGEPLVQECRGVILDHANNWAVVARPFDKFFNYGEGHAKPIDWSTARVLEKLDGSLMIMYYYDGEWHVASSGTPDAGGEVNGFGMTFRELFWKVWDESGYQRPITGIYHPQRTYMFELMTPYNRVVVQHKENRLALIGMRNLADGQEFEVGERWYDYMAAREEASLGISQAPSPPHVRVFPLQSTDDVLKTFETMNPLAQEGYVVVDGNFNRVKVKHPGYVAIHHMRDGFGPRRMLEVVRAGESSELLVHFPEWRPAYEEVQSKFEALVASMEAAYEAHKDIAVQKDFALAIKNVPFNSALFSLRAGKVPSIRAYLRDANIKHLVDHLKIKDIEL